MFSPLKIASNINISPLSTAANIVPGLDGSKAISEIVEVPASQKLEAIFFSFYLANPILFRE